MCFGPFSKICHWGPISALVIIKCVTGMTIHCSSLIWHQQSLISTINTICFMSLAGFTIYNFLSAVAHGPGFLPKNWRPVNKNDEKHMQFCQICQSYKAPRSHHCRKCDRCVLKMDHHCPWINNCVGWGNHGHFIAFLAFATIGCVYATVILGYTLYRSLYRLHYWRIYKQTPIIHLGVYGTICCVLSLGFAIGVIIAVGMLLFFQLKGVLRNRTGIEDWILEKANYRRKDSKDNFTYPYDLGMLRNIRQVLSLTCQPTGDGIEWEVKEDCDQYTLTREQLQQKKEKRDRSRVYVIVKDANGSWLPLSHGFGVLCHPPCTDEDRIKVEIGNEVIVTRWRKYWLFGEKIEPQNSFEPVKRVRGWFPRRCAQDLPEEMQPINFNTQKSEKKVE